MEIKYHKIFKKQYQKLPEKIQRQVDARILIFGDNKFSPLLNNHSVDPAYPSCRSINITGDYRAIYKEKEMGEIVIFIKLGTHSELY